MENLGQSDSVLKLVNGAAPLRWTVRSLVISSSVWTHPGFQGGIAVISAFRPRPSSDRRVFVAIGSNYLRLWASGRDSAAIAENIRTAWGIPNQPKTKPTQKSGAILALPLEMREFLNQFDCGLLPECQGEVGQIETRQLSELARAMPLSVGGHERFGRRSFPSILGDQRCVHPGLARFSG